MEIAGGSKKIKKNFFESDNFVHAIDILEKACYI